MDNLGTPPSLADVLARVGTPAAENQKSERGAAQARAAYQEQRAVLKAAGLEPVGSKGIVKVRYSHDAMIDMMIAEPMITQNALATAFGYTPSWVSQVINSDAFQAKFKARKGELTDPLIVRSVEERLKAAATRSLDIVLEKLDTATPDYALRVVQATSSALGYGARDRGPSGPQVAVVVQVPQQSNSSVDWAAKYNQAPPAGDQGSGGLPSVTVIENAPSDK